MTTARWRTLSSKVGIPRGRVSLPVPFGMYTRRTGGARYVPDLARSSSDCRFPSRSCSYSSAVCPSTPTAPSLRVRSYAWYNQPRSMWWAREVNPICGACFASSAIRCCRVDMSPSSDALAMFPSNDSAMRHPLPSPGSLRVRFSWFLGTMECSDALCPYRRASLPSLGDTRPCACLRFSLRPDAGRGPGAFGSGSSPPAFPDGRPQGLSGSWGTPVCLCPVLGPRQDRSARPYDVYGMAPVCGDDKGSYDEALSGLDSRASARAVYASPLRSPQDDARLASGCLASFSGGIGYPQGSYERFPVCFLHPVLLSQAFLTQRHSPRTPGGKRRSECAWLFPQSS